MLHTYFPILTLFVVAGGFAITMLVLAILLGPKKYSAVKDEPFECGTIGTGDPNARQSVKFYLVAMIFILFDIEVIFMYPWIVQVTELGWYGFWAMLSFLAIVSVGLAYVWRRGVLNWS